MQSTGKQIAFPIDAMLDQSIEQSAGAAPGMLTELVNLRKDRSGALVKRTGYPRVGAGGLQSTVRLIPHRNSVAQADSAALLLSYGEGTNKLALRDRTQQWVLTGARVVAQHPYTFTYGGCCSASGATFHIYIDQNIGAVKCVVVDEVSGDIIRGPEIVVSINTGLGETNFPLARIVTDGTNLWVFYQVTAGSIGIRCFATTVANIINPSGTWPAASSLGTMDPVNPSFDIHFMSGFAFAAYNYDNVGTKQVKVIRVNPSGTVTHTYTFDVSCRAVSCLFDGTQLWVLYALVGGGGINTDVRALSSTLALLATHGGPGSVSGVVETTSVGFYDSNSVLLVAASSSVTHQPNGHFVCDRADYAAGVITLSADLVCYGCYPASQPFRTGVGGDGSDCFMWVEFSTGSTDAFAAVALVALTKDGGTLLPTLSDSLFPHLRVQAGRVTAFPYQYSSLYVVPQKVYVSSDEPNTYVWDSCFRIPPETPAAVKEYRFQKASPYLNAVLTPTEAHGLTLLTGGAQCFSYDGSHNTELGFCYRPGASTDYVTMNGSGGSIGAGSYQWAVTYEFTDGAGLKHQSAPYFSAIKTAVANDKAILAVPTLKITAKQDREFSDATMRVVVWRTLSTDVVNFYRVTSATNNPEVNTVTVNDTAADASISSNEILYTIRGELANECPPPMWHAVAFSGRVAAIDAEYRDRIVFSKSLAAERGIEWSSANQTYVKGIGDLTALAEMDGNLYAFSASGVAWAASGSGIDNTGNGSWPEAQILSRACGCVDPRALCVSQDGVIFISQQGEPSRQAPGTLRAWLLPRGGGNPVEIGKAVRGYLSGTSSLGGAQLSITSCVNWVDGGRVVITLYDSSLAQSFWLEYDYVNRGADGLGVWNAGSGFSSGPIASACAARGAHWLGVSGDVLRSSETVFKDVGGQFYGYLVRTHDIKATAIPQSKLNQITITLATVAANGGVKVELSDDSWDNIAATNTFAFASVSADKAVRQWQPAVRRSSKGIGYSVQISSLTPGGSGDTADVIPRAISIDMLPLRGTYRPQASERA